MYGKLHHGELETIVGGMELQADFVRIDERAARNVAMTFFLAPIGTVPSQYFVKKELLSWLECKWCAEETVHTEGSWNKFSGPLSLECSKCRAFKVFKVHGDNELEVISDTGKPF